MNERLQIYSASFFNADVISIDQLCERELPEITPAAGVMACTCWCQFFNEDAILLAHPVPTRASHRGQPCMGPVNGLWLWPRAFHFHKWHTSVKACAHCINRVCMSPWSAIVDADISVQLFGSVLLSSPVLPAVLMSYTCCHVVVLPMMLTSSSHMRQVPQPCRFHSLMCLQ